MSVRIRLRRVGRKKQPYFRIVVMPSDAPRDGAYIEEVGFYNPRTRPAYLTMDLGKVDAWLGKGAEVSDSAASLIRKARKGGDDAVRLAEPGEAATNLATASKPERRAQGAVPAAQAGSPTVEPETDPLEGAAPDAEKAPPSEATDGQTKQAVEALAPKEDVAETSGATADEAPPVSAGPVTGQAAAEETTEASAATGEAEGAPVEEGKAEAAAAVETTEPADEEPKVTAEAEAEAPESDVESETVSQAEKPAKPQAE
jgi:small subunit ribosomal protein S16